MIVEIPSKPLLADSEPDVLVCIAGDLGSYIRERLDQAYEVLAASVDVHDGKIVVGRIDWRLNDLKGFEMFDIRVRGVIPYVFCADAGAIADWCVGGLVILVVFR